MAISMLIKNRSTRQSEEIPICTNSTFHAYWERAATEKGLDMIRALGGLWVTAEYRDQFLDELAKLKVWADARAGTDDYLSEMNQRIDRIVEAITSHSFDEYEFSFG